MNNKTRQPNPTIAFDTWILGSHGRNHGIHVYAKKLLGYFREMAPQYAVEIAPYVSYVTDNAANQFAVAPGFRPKQTRLLTYSRWWRWGGAQLVTSIGKPAVVFSPAGTTLYFGSRVPLVATIHDLIPVIMSAGSKRTNRALRLAYWSAAKFSQQVITDSMHSKSDLMNLYKVPESKISVVHLGCDHETFNNLPTDPELRGTLLHRLGIAKPYIMHHGVIKSYKNLKRLIQAYRLLLERNHNLDAELVLAGSLGWGYEDVLAEAARCEGRRGKVLFTQALNDQDLVLLIKGASLEVIPSLYEGFCLPMVESMACGIPTIAANRSCLPEISGGVLRYFDPESIDEMAACMEEALENQVLRQELSLRGQMRAREFDWRRCAEQTLEILAQAARRDTSSATCTV